MKRFFIISLLITHYSLLTLAQNDSIVLEQVVITGTRTPKTLKNTPVQTRLITSMDIQKTDATDIQDVLQQQIPGVEFSYAMNQQTHFNFSGFGGQSVLFLVDGERLAGETMDDVDFTRLTMTNVDHIEIIKGAASALYGSNATGGVINIITKIPQDSWSLNVNGRYGKHNQYRYGGSLGLGNKWLHNMLSFTGTNSDNYNVSNGPASEAVTQYYVTQYYGDRTYNLSDRLTWQPFSRLRLSARAAYFFRQNNTSSPQLPNHYRDLSAGAKGVWTLSDNDNVELSYSFDQYDKAIHNIPVGTCVRQYSNVQNSVRALYNHTFRERDILTVGADYLRDYLSNPKMTETVHIQHSADFFAQYDWTISPRWELVGALRYDYFSEGKNQQVTPKLNLRYSALRNLTFRLAYGMGFRAPTLKERFYSFDMAGIWIVEGNSDLKSELSHNLTASVDWYHGPYNITGMVYYNNIHNRITTGAPYSDETKQLYLPYVNLANYSSYGLEVNAQARWNCGIGAKLSYSFTHETLATDKDGNTVNNQYIPARPHSFTTSVDYDHQFTKNYGFNVILSGRVLSAVNNLEYVNMYDTSQGKHSCHYPAYTIWKLQLVQRFWKGIHLTLTADNLFDYNPKFHYFNSPFTDGFTLMAGISLDIDKMFK